MRMEREAALRIFRRIGRSETKGELIVLIGAEVRGYSLTDLQRVRGVIENECRSLPRAYKSLLLPKSIEQVFDAHHCLMSLYRKKETADRHPTDEKLSEFCTMAGEAVSNAEDPEVTMLYYLLAAFTTYVMELPGHPVGTPFPGGKEVTQRAGIFYCPIRDKEDDVETAICPYCVARQDEE